MRNKPVCSDEAPPDNTPIGNIPDGVNPFNSNTDSLSFLHQTNKIKDIEDEEDRYFWVTSFFY